METPQQIGYGLASFLLALVVFGTLVFLFIPIIGQNAWIAANLKSMSVGVFLILWWCFYIMIVRIKKNSAEQARQDNKE